MPLKKAANPDRETGAAPSHSRPTILLIAGFGDDSSMFAGLRNTERADSYALVPLDLPGFGVPRLTGDTTLQSLAEFVANKAVEKRAEIIVAHSVASIIASLAASTPACPLKTIISLEGNITADDAYFSGTAADYDSAEAFHSAFLSRLDKMAASAPIIARYRSKVAQADPVALWQLGCDAHRFSREQVPGEVLSEAADAIYFYNPENCPRSTLEWLDDNPMKRVILQDATHWKSVDQPALLAQKILGVLS